MAAAWKPGGGGHANAIGWRDVRTTTGRNDE